MLVSLVMMAMALVLGGVATAVPALAHAAATTIEPADGSSLAAPPARVAVTLSETPLPGAARLALTGPEGPVRLSVGAQGNAVIGKVPSQMVPGAYTLTWRIASQDGHVVSGRSTFTITASTVASAAPSPTEDGAAGPTAQESTSPRVTVATTESTPSSPATASSAAPTDNRSQGWFLWGAPALAALAGVGYLLVRRQRVPASAEQPHGDH